MAPGDREPKGRSMDDRSKTDRLCADGRKIGFVPMDAATSIGVRVRVKTDPAVTRIEEEAIGYDEWMPKGLKKGLAACRWKIDSRDRTTTLSANSNCRRRMESMAID